MRNGIISKKAVIFGIILLFFGASFIQQTKTTVKADLTNGLVGYWNLNEGSGTIANDDSGNENDGTINGATWTTDTPNNEGYALNLSGSDNYVIRNPFNDFPMTQITATFWMKTSDTSKDGCPVCYYATANDFVISNYRDFAMVIGDQTIGPTGVSANDGIWHHIAITWNSINGQMKLYKDGVVEYTGTVLTGGSITQNGSLVIGCDQDCIGGCFEANQFFKGIIDEVRIYNRILTIDEIEELVAGIITNQPPTADAGGPYYANVNNAITFSGSGSSDTDGTIAGYRWDFTNDGTYDTGWLTSATTTHSYSSAGLYTVKLEVKDNNGAFDNDTAIATITSEGGAIPTADVNGPYSGYVNNPVTFSSAGSVGGSEGTITSWYWTFGDGMVSSQQNPSHTYTSSGTFTVTLKVTNNYGQTDTDTTSATISDISSDQSPPIANAGGPYKGVIGTPISFNGSGSSDADGTIVSYLWNFGDSTTGTGISPTHTYTIPGNYSVILTVTDNDSLTHSNSTTANINVSGPPTIVISVDMSNIEPIAEGNEKTIPVTVYCYHQAVSNIHIHFLEWSNLTVNQSSPNITLNPGESGELLIRIKAPKLKDINNSDGNFSSETLVIQAVSDNNVTSNNETINIIVVKIPPKIPGFETIATITAIGSAGALVTFFRRRNRNR